VNCNEPLLKPLLLAVPISMQPLLLFLFLRLPSQPFLMTPQPPPLQQQHCQQQLQPLRLFFNPHPFMLHPHPQPSLLRLIMRPSCSKQ
jgi:hypothetical protein